MSRQKLLSPYLDTQVWIDFSDAIDAVFVDTIDNPTRLLSKLRGLQDLYSYDSAFLEDPRDRYTVQPYTGTLVDTYATEEIRSFTDLLGIESSLMVEQLKLQGFSLPGSNLVYDQELNTDLHRIIDSLGQYYTEKGSGYFLDYISYILNADISGALLWTTDYVHFYEEGDPIIGTPVWAGGTWYPTTKMNLSYDYETVITNQPEIELLGPVFKTMAPINLLLNLILAKAAGTMYMGISMAYETLIITPFFGPVEDTLNVNMAGVTTIITPYTSPVTGVGTGGSGINIEVNGNWLA